MQSVFWGWEGGKGRRFKRDGCAQVSAESLSHICFFVTSGTVACQAPLSLGLSRQEYWSGLPCPPPGHLPETGIKPVSLMSPALAERHH